MSGTGRPGGTGRASGTGRPSGTGRRGGADRPRAPSRAAGEATEGRRPSPPAPESHPRGAGQSPSALPPAARAAAPAPAPSSATLDGLVASKEIVIACGPGGVGKTTVAAATAAMAASRHGGRVLVLTIDPARRLADALGLSGPSGEGLGNTERRIPDEVFAAAPGSRSRGRGKPRGELWAAMLDTKQSWDALVRRYAPDRGTQERILSNPLYRNISGRFVQSHDYIAMERLYDLHSQGNYDLIVLDTAPTRNAIDFLDAPQRMAEFFSSRLLRWLTAPYRSRVVSLASKPFSQAADRILGTQFVQDIAEFFILFQSMYDGFVERAGAVTRLLSDRRTTFLVVSTLEEGPVREADYFASALAARHLPLGAVVLNKVLPSYFRDPDAARLARRLRDASAAYADPASRTLGTDPELTERVLFEVAESFLNFGVVARREAEQQAELASRSAARPELLATVPFFDDDIVDMHGLLALGEALWS